MSQRPSGYARLENDAYQTPAWVTRALVPYLIDVRTILEPAAGTGNMVRVLRAAGFEVTAQDIADDLDFLTIRRFDADAIVTNPPFKLAEAFIDHALWLTRPKSGCVAMLLRCDYDHAQRRADLFGHPFACKLALRRRIVWFKRPGAAPSYNHAWFVWDWRHKGPPTIAYGP